MDFLGLNNYSHFNLPQTQSIYNFYLNTIISMCFLKQLQRISAFTGAKILFLDDTDEYSSQESIFPAKKYDNILNILKIQTSQVKGNQKEMFKNLFSLLSYNSVLMNSLETKMILNNEAMDSLNTVIVQKAQKDSPSSLDQTQISESSKLSQKCDNCSNDVLTQKLFGKKSYKYKLQLTQQFSEVIYKQRNISFSLTLTNLDGQRVRNANMINLCLGVCNHNGEWICQTKNGENFMKGKTQAELYYGESNFQKIYPRDVSRGYEEGKVSFVVYSKPSMLHFSGKCSSMETKVNFDQIQPLVIRDLTIRAKKKQ